MEEILFIYKNNNIKIKYNENEIMGDLFKKCAAQLKKNIDEIYFKYNGKIINKDIIIKDIIKDKNKKTRILNSFESWNNINKVTTETFKYKNAYEIKYNIEIQINDNIVPFSYFYEFKIPGKYIIKYIFKNLLTKTVCLFADCTLLKKVDLSNFNTEKVTNMNSMFNGCKLLNEINLANINTQNVTDMACFFRGCESLKNIDVSNFNTEKVTNMGGMFYECNHQNFQKCLNLKQKMLQIWVVCLDYVNH